MLLHDLLQTATQGMTRNVSRSLLTTLGIIIGVGSVVLMVSIGASFRGYILSQVETFSAATFEIHAKGLQEFGKATESISDADFDALSKLSTVTSAAPVVFVGQPVKYGKEEKKPTIFGSTKEIFNNFSLKLDHGRILTDGDVKGASNVAVLGSQTATDLFSNQNPVGQRISIGDQKFTVVGVLLSFGSALTANLDAQVYIPITVAKVMTGKYQFVDYVSLQSVGDITFTEIDIKSLLRQRHKITNPTDDPAKDDFIARSFSQAMDIISTVTLSISIFLSLIAGISLVVGGIGIMNIMLVSVSERTKEIGLRKAVGARNRDILFQFLFEAVTLTLIGGIIGLIGGTTMGFILARIAARFLGTFPFSLTPLSVFLALSMAVGTGVVFGLYPAQKAAKLHPIEALRFE
ncbi:MAG: ABC transporter permease [Candidatus Peregrinibacteria bacterium]